MFISGPAGAGVQPGVKLWVSLDAKALKKMSVKLMAPNGTTRGGCCHVNFPSTSPFLYHQENLTYPNNGMVNEF